jgi:hypothetical protein
MQLRTAALLFNLFVSGGVIAAQPKIDSLTHRYDNMRSGVNLKETILKKSNVNTKSFGKLTFRNVDGNIYAQPLVVTQAAIANRANPVNVVIVVLLAGAKSGLQNQTCTRRSEVGGL